VIVRENFDLSGILYYRIGGKARFLLEAFSEQDILEALDFVRANRVDRLVVVGLGSNLLFRDDPFDGAVLRISSPADKRSRRSLIDLGDGRIAAFAGLELDEVIGFGFSRGYVGLEWAGGLPGTVGAAVRGNVGAFGGEISEVLEGATILEIGPTSVQRRLLSNQELGFAYRDSTVKRNRRLLVVSAIFKLQPAEEATVIEARRLYHSHIDYRQQNHPMEYPTCGSVFKNVERRDQVERIVTEWPDIRDLVDGRWHGKVSMGYAINRLGLAGHQIGMAQISRKHSNFIVNLGGASFADVLGIIETVEQRFAETFGFTPETEVEIIR